MTTAFQCIANSAKRKTSPTCPFTKKASKGAVLLKVPLELRGALVKAENIAAQAAEVPEKCVLQDGREWLWEKEIADAILTLVWQALQKRYHKSGAYHPRFCGRWRFFFERT